MSLIPAAGATAAQIGVVLARAGAKTAITGSVTVAEKAHRYLKGAGTAMNPLPPSSRTFIDSDLRALRSDLNAVCDDVGRASVRRLGKLGNNPKE